MTPQNIELKVRYNVALIYIVAAIMGIFMLAYLYQARKHIDQQRCEIEHYRDLRSVTHRLIRSVHESQTLYAQYISTKNPILLQDFDLNLLVIDRIIDTLNTQPHSSLPITRIRGIIDLLNQQSRTTRTLKQLFEAQNPLNSIQTQLKNQSSRHKPDSVFVRNYTHRQIAKPTPKRGFFKRVAEVFSPSKDSITETVLNSRDTLIVASSESLIFSDEMNRATQEAGNTYNERMRSIEQSLNQLIISNQTISTQIANLLFDLQEESFASILAAINRSEVQINRSYTHSVIGGIAAFLLILLFVILLLRNVDRAKQARLDLEEANFRIRRIMESRHQLLLSVSHDLKTPLSSILGYLECLQDDHPNEMRSMRNSGNYILTLLESLLEYSCIEQGSLTVTQSRFAPYSLLYDLSEMFQPIATQKGLCFTVDLEFSEAIVISSDAIKIKQIAANLLSNALKYTQEGGVGWLVRCEGGMLTLEVTDTGVGIPKSLQQNLFKPFSRIEQNNHLAHGSGLGLYVVKGLIDLLRGTLSWESEEGRGSRFTVRIPVLEVEAVVSNRSRTIIVIDDDATVSELLVHMLRSLGHTVRTAAPDSSYDPCDLIITDLEMGQYSGVDVLRKAGNTLVVLMTGRSDFSKEDALRLGFSDYLPKPFSRETIRMIIGEAAMPPDTLLGEDEEFRKHITSLFKKTVEEYFGLLKEALANDNFDAARALCHKMMPSFAEFGFDNIVPLLRNMDSHQALPPYKEWKEDVRQIRSLLAELL